MNKTKKDYLSVIYNEKDRPFTNYPDKLTRHLVEIFNLEKQMKLLDVGCGRGEFLKGFINIGLDCYGIDQSEAAKKFCPEANIKVSDIQNYDFPYDDNCFDVIFSKSVIEHFYYPEKIVKEIYRILKPGGIVITLTPDWHYNYRMFYEDYTHRTPFIDTSLKDIFLIHHFNEVKVEKFKQLPILWKKNLILLVISELTRIILPNIFKKYFKWVKFSKEIMLICIARKPIE